MFMRPGSKREAKTSAQELVQLLADLCRFRVVESLLHGVYDTRERFLHVLCSGKGKQTEVARPELFGVALIRCLDQAQEISLFPDRLLVEVAHHRIRLSLVDLGLSCQ